MRTREKWYKELEIRKDDLSNALTSVQSDSLVLVFPKSTNTPLKSINHTSQTTHHMETSQKSIQQLFPTSTSSFDDSLARLFQSLESGEALRIPEERSSLNLREYCAQNNLDYLSLRMFEDFSATTTEKLSAPSSPRLMSWGMIANGKCLTARITESLRIGRESSLSDILEEHVDQKYFLSELAMKNIFEKQTSKGARLHSPDDQQEGETVGETISSEHFAHIKTEIDSEKWKNDSVQPSLQEPERTEADNQSSESLRPLDSDSATQGGGFYKPFQSELTNEEGESRAVSGTDTGHTDATVHTGVNENQEIDSDWVWETSGLPWQLDKHCEWHSEI